MSKSAKKTPKKQTQVPSPSAVARQVVDEYLDTDFDSEFVGTVEEQVFERITDAVRRHRLAKEAAGKSNPMKGREAEEHDYRSAAFRMGVALGAKLRGAR